MWIRIRQEFLGPGGFQSSPQLHNFRARAMALLAVKFRRKPAVVGAVIAAVTLLLVCFSNARYVGIISHFLS